MEVALNMKRSDLAATVHSEFARIDSARFAAQMQNCLMKVSDSIAGMQTALTACWHKLGNRNVSVEDCIDFLLCMMTPTRMSVASLKFEMAKLQDAIALMQLNLDKTAAKFAGFFLKHNGPGKMMRKGWEMMCRMVRERNGRRNG